MTTQNCRVATVENETAIVAPLSAVARSMSGFYYTQEDIAPFRIILMPPINAPTAAAISADNGLSAGICEHRRFSTIDGFFYRGNHLVFEKGHVLGIRVIHSRIPGSNRNGYRCGMRMRDVYCDMLW